MNIALVGMMGAGKSEAGRRLAGELGFRFADTDELVAQAAGKGVLEIFEQDGEARFRQLEREAISDAVLGDRTVIACGGGVVESEASLAALLENALVFYLKIAPEQAAQRIANRDMRPLLRGRNAAAVLVQLLDGRSLAYERAHFTVDAGGSVQQVVSKIRAILSAKAAVCAVVCAEGKEAAIEQIRMAAAGGADIVELRLDLIGAGEEDLAELAGACSRTGVQFVATCREADEGGRYSGGQEEKLGLLAKASFEGAAFVDVELGKETLLREIRRRVAGKSKVIASFHDFGGRIQKQELLEVLRKQSSAADVGKIACKINALEAAVMMELQTEANKMGFPLVLTPMGKGVFPTRIACSLAGTAFTYAAAGESTAPGQPALEQVKNVLKSIGGGIHASGFTFGEKFRIEVFGSSHGPAVGVEVFGCPAGIRVGEADLQAELDKRKPGQSLLTSPRKEEDKVVIESGISDGVTTGGTIRMLVRNKDVISAHYAELKNKPRPGHADYPALVKYGSNEPGGGFFSGRMTAAFVMAGAVAKKLLEERGVRTMAFAKQIGTMQVDREVSEEEILGNTYNNPVHTAAPEKAEEMAAEVEAARMQGDSVGGVIECRVTGLPPGIGEPMFESIESVVAKAVFAIPAVKGIEFGSGFAGSRLRGSENNDAYALGEGGKVITLTNNSGGILGGLTTGMPIVLRVAVKPTSSIHKPQRTVDLAEKREVELVVKGRHDPCIAIRAVPVVESVAAFCIADILLKDSKGGGLNG